MRDNSPGVVESGGKRGRLSILNDEDRSIAVLADFARDAHEDPPVIRDRHRLRILQAAGQNRR